MAQSRPSNESNIARKDIEASAGKRPRPRGRNVVVLKGAKGTVPAEAPEDPAAAIDRDALVLAARRAGWIDVPTGMRKIGARGSQCWTRDGWKGDALALMRELPVEEAPAPGPEGDAEGVGHGNDRIPGAYPGAGEGAGDAPSSPGASGGRSPYGPAHAGYDAPALTLPWSAGHEPEFPSLAALRQDGTDSLCVGFDSEWLSLDGGRRRILSYQFAVIDPPGMGRGHCLLQLVIISLRARKDPRGFWEYGLPCNLLLSTLFRCLHLKKHVRDRVYMYGFRLKGQHSPCEGDLPEGWAVAPGDDGKPVTYAPTRELATHADNLVYDSSTHSFDEALTVGDLGREGLARGGGLEACEERVFPIDPEDICLITHFGRVDVSAMLGSGMPLLRRCADAGGLVTLRPFYMVVPCRESKRNDLVYNVRLSVRDTMAQAPAGHRTLDDLGRACGVRKVILSDALGDGRSEEDVKAHMDMLLRDHPQEFLDYSSWDAVVCLTYLASIYGVNKACPPTLPSAGARAMRRTMLESLGRARGVDTTAFESVKDENEFFDKTYRGLRRERKGLEKDPDGRLRMTEGYEAVSLDVKRVQEACAEAYHGGYNACSTVGWLSDQLMYDYDLRNAYPTAMCLVADIDWDHPVKAKIAERELTEDDLPDPVSPFVAYVSFEFPEDVRYPCITQRADGVPVYTRTSAGVEGVWAMGPDIWLALRLGAKVICIEGYALNVLRDASGEESHCLRDAVRQIVDDRASAKRRYGDESLLQEVLKLIANSGYGKTAQGVRGKRSFDAWHDAMASVGLSAVSSPYAAAMTTSIVRCALIATMNQLEEKGLPCVSVTTDGFITAAGMDALEACDMHGLKPVLEAARTCLAGDPEVWQLKHVSDDLLNFSTRGNVSARGKGSMGVDGPEDEAPSDGEPLYAGVCAHNSLRTGEIKGTIADRLRLMRAVVTRDGRVRSTSLQFTSFHDLCDGKPMRCVDKDTWISLDFDMKRRPVRESIESERVDISFDIEGGRWRFPDPPLRRDYDDEAAFRDADAQYLRDMDECMIGVHGVVARVETVPFEDVAEFMAYRRVAQDVKKARVLKDGTVVSGCLRTKRQWMSYLDRVEASLRSEQRGTMRVGKNGLAWSVLTSCVRGHRLGLWDIPALDSGTLAERVAWINEHNDSEKPFTKDDWKNCGRRRRSSSVLAVSMLEPKLSEMGAVMPAGDGDAA